MIKKETGITLIALTITIIIMLILAGVAISLTIGDNGIFKKSEQSIGIYNKEEATEKMNMKITSSQMHTYAKEQRMPTLQELSDALCEDEEMEYVVLESKAIASLEKITVGDKKSIFTKIKKYPYEFEIDSNLRLASIDGVKLAENDTTNEELKLAVEELKTNVKELKEDNEILKQSNEELKNRITVLEDETIYNKRVKLTNKDIEIPVQVTAWKSGDYGTIELTDSIEGYKYLEIQTDAKHNQIYTYNKTILLDVEQLKYYDSNTYNANISGAEVLLEAISGTNVTGLCTWFRNSKLLQIGAIWNNAEKRQAIRIKAIYGIK